MLLNLTADKYKDSTPDGGKNTDNTAKNAEPLINLDGKCAAACCTAASYVNVFHGPCGVLQLLNCYNTVIHRAFRSPFTALGMQSSYILLQVAETASL